MLRRAKHVVLPDSFFADLTELINTCVLICIWILLDVSVLSFLPTAANNRIS